MQIKVAVFVSTEPIISLDKARQIVESLSKYTKWYKRALIVYSIDKGAEAAAAELSRWLKEPILPNHGEYGLVKEYCHERFFVSIKRGIEVLARKYSAKVVYILAPGEVIDEFSKYYCNKVESDFSHKKPTTNYSVTEGSTFVLRNCLFGHRLHGFTIDYPNA